MEILTKTEPAEGHDHLVYYQGEVDEMGNTVSEMGFTSTDAGHAHAVMRIPETDQQGNLVGEYLVALPTPEHDHQHVVYQAYPTDYTNSVPDKETDEQEIVREAIALFAQLKNDHEEVYEEYQKAFDFYQGEQWDISTKQSLKAEQRSALTLNFIENLVDKLSGYQREDKKDFRYVPTKGGSQKVADILNLVKSDILADCNFMQEKAEVAEAQIIAGRGDFHVYVDDDEDFDGKIKIECFPSKSVFYGPHQKKDGSDIAVTIVFVQKTLNEVKAMFVEKADEIETNWNLFYNDLNLRGISLDIKDYPDNVTGFETLGNSPLEGLWKEVFDLTKRTVTVLEIYRDSYHSAPVITGPSRKYLSMLNDEVVWVKDSKAGLPVNIRVDGYGWSKKDIRRARGMGFEITPRTRRFIRETVIAGNVLISDEDPSFIPGNRAPYIPVYAKKQGDKFWGKVKSGMDAQDRLNKAVSFANDVMLSMLGQGWFYQDDMFDGNSETEERFLDKVCQPNFAIKVNDIERRPVKSEPPQFPVALAQFMDLALSHLTQLMNIQPEPGGANESGAHLLHRTKEILKSNLFLFDNMSVALKELGKRLVYYIQAYCPPEKIAKIVKSAKPNSMVDGQPVEEITDQEIMELISDINVAEYVVEAVESTYTPTTRLAVLLTFQDLNQKGYQIPFNSLVDYFDLPETEKEKLLQQFAAQQQADAEREAQVQETELLKSKGMVPPRLIAKLEDEKAQIDQQRMQQRQQMPPQ